MYLFCSSFFPVSRTFSALMTITKSPVSTWGVKIAFSLPRNKLAAFIAIWPSTWSLASITHHLRETSVTLAEKVFIRAEKARKLRAVPRSVKFSLEMRFVQLVFFCGLCAPECSSRRKRTRFKRHRHSGDQHCATKSSFLRDVCSRVAVALQRRLRRSSGRNAMADKRGIGRARRDSALPARNSPGTITHAVAGDVSRRGRSLRRSGWRSHRTPRQRPE